MGVFHKVVIAVLNFFQGYSKNRESVLLEEDRGQGQGHPSAMSNLTPPTKTKTNILLQTMIMGSTCSTTMSTDTSTSTDPGQLDGEQNQGQRSLEDKSNEVDVPEAAASEEQERRVSLEDGKFLNYKEFEPRVNRDKVVTFKLEEVKISYQDSGKGEDEEYDELSEEEDESTREAGFDADNEADNDQGLEPVSSDEYDVEEDWHGHGGVFCGVTSKEGDGEENEGETQKVRGDIDTMTTTTIVYDETGGSGSKEKSPGVSETPKQDENDADKVTPEDKKENEPEVEKEPVVWIVDPNTERPWVRKPLKELDPGGLILQETIRMGEEIRKKYNELAEKQGKSKSKRKIFATSTKDIREMIQGKRNDGQGSYLLDAKSPLTSSSKKAHKKVLISTKTLVASIPVRRKSGKSSHSHSRGRLMKIKSKESESKSHPRPLLDINNNHIVPLGESSSAMAAFAGSGASGSGTSTLPTDHGVPEKIPVLQESTKNKGRSKKKERSSLHRLGVQTKHGHTHLHQTHDHVAAQHHVMPNYAHLLAKSHPHPPPGFAPRPLQQPCNSNMTMMPVSLPPQQAPQQAVAPPKISTHSRTNSARNPPNLVAPPSAAPPPRLDNPLETEAMMQYNPGADSKHDMIFGNVMGVHYGGGYSHPNLGAIWTPNNSGNGGGGSIGSPVPPPHQRQHLHHQHQSGYSSNPSPSQNQYQIRYHHHVTNSVPHATQQQQQQMMAQSQQQLPPLMLFSQHNSQVGGPPPGQQHAHQHAHHHQIQQSHNQPPPPWFYGQPAKPPPPRCMFIQRPAGPPTNIYPMQQLQHGPNTLMMPSRTHYWQDVLDQNTRQLQAQAQLRNANAGNNPGRICYLKTPQQCQQLYTQPQGVTNYSPFQPHGIPMQQQQQQQVSYSQNGHSPMMTLTMSPSRQLTLTSSPGGQSVASTNKSVSPPPESEQERSSYECQTPRSRSGTGILAQALADDINGCGSPPR